MAIVLFVGAAVYLNWSYSKEAAEGADGENGGKLKEAEVDNINEGIEICALDSNIYI